MIQAYVNAAMRKAAYKQLENGDWFAEIEGFPGVWASASGVEECREELMVVLEEWLVLKIGDREELPVVDGRTIKITHGEVA